MTAYLGRKAESSEGGTARDDGRHWFDGVQQELEDQVSRREQGGLRAWQQSAGLESGSVVLRRDL